MIEIIIIVILLLVVLAFIFRDKLPTKIQKYVPAFFDRTKSVPTPTANPDETVGNQPTAASPETQHSQDTTANQHKDSGQFKQSNKRGKKSASNGGPITTDKLTVHCEDTPPNADEATEIVASKRTLEEISNWEMDNKMVDIVYDKNMTLKTRKMLLIKDAFLLRARFERGNNPVIIFYDCNVTEQMRLTMVPGGRKSKRTLVVTLPYQTPIELKPSKEHVDYIGYSPETGNLAVNDIQVVTFSQLKYMCIEANSYDNASFLPVQQV